MYEYSSKPLTPVYEFIFWQIYSDTQPLHSAPVHLELCKLELGSFYVSTFPGTDFVTKTWEATGSECEINLPPLSPPLVTRYLFLFALNTECICALRPSSPIFFPWSTTPPPIECKGAIFPNDRRHRFSSQTFL